MPFDLRRIVLLLGCKETLPAKKGKDKVYMLRLCFKTLTGEKCIKFLEG